MASIPRRTRVPAAQKPRRRGGRASWALALLVVLAALALPAAADPKLDPSIRLALALSSNDREALQAVLREAPQAARIPIGEGDLRVSPLAYGLVLGTQLPLLQDLLDAGAEVRTRDPRMEPPLCTAVSMGRLDAVQLLLSRGAEPNVVFQRLTPLHRTAYLVSLPPPRGDQAVPIAEALLQAGADPNVPLPPDDEGRKATLLEFAREMKLEGMVKVLRKFGAK